MAHRLANILYLIGQADISSLAQLGKCSTPFIPPPPQTVLIYLKREEQNVCSAGRKIQRGREEMHYIFSVLSPQFSIVSVPSPFPVKSDEVEGAKNVTRVEVCWWRHEARKEGHLPLLPALPSYLPWTSKTQWCKPLVCPLHSPTMGSPHLYHSNHTDFQFWVILHILPYLLLPAPRKDFLDLFPASQEQAEPGSGFPSHATHLLLYRRGPTWTQSFRRTWVWQTGIHWWPRQEEHPWASTAKPWLD